MQKINNLNWDVAWLPKGEKNITPQFGACWALISGSRNKTQAWRVIKFFTGKQYETLLARSGHDIPAIKSVAYSYTKTVVMYPDRLFQKFKGWGTSLCWFAKVIGGWPDSERNAIADLIFAPENLGFNIARYNNLVIGEGSYFSFREEKLM